MTEVPALQKVHQMKYDFPFPDLLQCIILTMYCKTERLKKLQRFFHSKVFQPGLLH